MRGVDGEMQLASISHSTSHRNRHRLHIDLNRAVAAPILAEAPNLLAYKSRAIRLACKVEGARGGMTAWGRNLPLYFRTSRINCECVALQPIL